MNVNTTSNLYTSTTSYGSYAENAVQANAIGSVTKTATVRQESVSGDRTVSQNSQDRLELNGKTSLPAASILEKMSQYTKVIDEHYAKVNKESLRIHLNTLKINIIIKNLLIT